MYGDVFHRGFYEQNMQTKRCCAWKVP